VNIGAVMGKSVSREYAQLFCLAAILSSCLLMPFREASGQVELSIDEEDFKKLDTFEGHVLSKADKVFGEKDYRRAAAEYDAFILQFPKSLATPYAVFRKARCLQLDNKRNEAIREYTQILDYFPNSVRYAAAALYYIGECHFQNGDVKEAMKAWAELAADEDYRKHYLAAGAINRLGDYLVSQQKPGEAVEYYKQVAIDFRKSNPDAARYAMSKVLDHYIRTQPDEPKLREFYEQVQTFEWDPARPGEDNYWFRLRENIKSRGNFGETEADMRMAYYGYWAGVMQGKRPDDDDFQIDYANFRLAADGNGSAWAAFLDKQFAAGWKDGDWDRIIKWISVFRSNKNKVQEYYAKLDLSRMTAKQLERLMKVLYDEVGDASMAKNVFSRIKLDDLNDQQKYNLERYLWQKDGSLVEIVCQSMADSENGRMELLRYYHWSRNYAKGMPLADECAGFPRFGKEAYWLKAEMLQWQGKYQDAIKAYQQADNPPHNLWRIADCHIAMGKRELAIAQYREIENFFPDQAPEAALRIAYQYRDMKDQKQYVANLRGIMKKYPKSGQSSTAHLELESMGIAIGGGVDAE